jgi:hypothetical protein
MSHRRSNKRQPAGQGPGLTSRPQTGGRSIHTVSLLLLLGVVFVVALLMVVSLVGFVLKPDRAVRAGPMYVTLTLTTGAALLMLIMALNASYLPFVSRQRAPNAYLIMSAMGVTGVVTGLLTVGRAASPFVIRLALGSIALMFITRQNARLARAREAARARQTGPPAPGAQRPATRAQQHSRSRQRRGGRKQ